MRRDFPGRRAPLRAPVRPRGAPCLREDPDVSEKAAAVEISYLDLMINQAEEGSMKEWLKGLLERFKEFASPRSSR